MTTWHFKRGVEEQTKAFLDGFNEVVPLHWLQFYDERELELMLCGMQELNVSEWEKNTVYRNYTRSTKQIQWFWQVSERYTSGFDREMSIEFVTVCQRVIDLALSSGPTQLLQCIYEKSGLEGLVFKIMCTT